MTVGTETLTGSLSGDRLLPLFRSIDKECGQGARMPLDTVSCRVICNVTTTEENEKLSGKVLWQGF